VCTGLVPQFKSEVRKYSGPPYHRVYAAFAAIQRMTTVSDEKPRAKLSDKQARGGVIGGKGYGFQAAYIVSRIPLWLADPDFVQFLQEGASDVDVRFNRPGGEERWYIQVKNYAVTPTTAREVFAQFRETDAGSPGTYTHFTLACPSLNKDLKRLRTAVEELRGATGFFRPGQDAILDNTWADLESLVQELNLPVDARFLADKVHFDTDLAGLTDDTSLCNLFVGSLLRLETWARVPPDGAARAYEKLALLCRRALRQTCSREQVEALIREAMGEVPVEAAHFVVPFIRNPDFVGREEDLERLHQALMGKGPVGIRPASARPNWRSSTPTATPTHTPAACSGSTQPSHWPRASPSWANGSSPPQPTAPWTSRSARPLATCAIAPTRC